MTTGMCYRLASYSDITRQTAISACSLLQPCSSAYSPLLVIAHMPQKPFLSIRRNLIPLCIFLTSLVITLASWQYTSHVETQELQGRFVHLSQDNQKLLQLKIERHMEVLYGLRGFVANMPTLSRPIFENFARSTAMLSQYPGIHMIGYLPLVAQQDKAGFQQQMRREGLLGYQIKSSGEHSYYLPEAYIYPTADTVLGNDIYSRYDRRPALDMARDTGMPWATYKTFLDSDPQKRPAFVVYFPVYRAGLPTNTAEQRRQAIRGYVFETFIAPILIQHTLGSHAIRQFDLAFIDGAELTSKHVLYGNGEDAKAETATTGHKPLQYQTALNFAGRHWPLIFTATPAFYEAYHSNISQAVLVGGVMTSILLFAVALLLQNRQRLQQMQEERNQRFRSLFEQNPDAVYSFDLSGNFTEANAVTSALTGIPFEELIGKSFTPFIAPDCLEASKERFARAASGTATYGELTIINRADERIEISTTNVPIIKDGKVVGVFGIAKDVTQRKQTEAQNLQMRQFLDAALENLPTMLFVKEADTLRFITWNKASEEQTGIPREEIIGKTDYDFFNKQDADYFTSKDRAILARCEPMDIAEEPIQTRHHGIRLLHTRKVPFKMGNAEYLLGISEDITERRQAEEALKQAHAELEERVRQRTRALRHEIEARRKSERALLESEEKYRSIFEQAPVGIAHMNEDGRLSKINQKFCDIVGYSVDELSHLTYFDITHPDDLKKSKELVRQVNEREVISASREKRYLRKDGAEVWVNVTRSAILGADNEVNYYLGIVEDITQRKETEAALRELTLHLQTVREDERTRIAREIHDELGGVLAAVKFDLSIPVRTRDKDTEGATHRNQETIKLVDNAIIALRRIMSDLRPSVLDDLGLWAGLEWLAADFESRMKIKTIFKLKGAEIDVEPNRATDIFRMVQESLNNVAKHAQATAVNIVATTTDNEIIIRLNDNGRGISKDEKSKARSFGLIGMQERAQAFGGVVKINGSPGKGTTVSIKCPVCDK